jgi:hypothetical protein
VGSIYSCGLLVEIVGDVQNWDFVGPDLDGSFQILSGWLHTDYEMISALIYDLNSSDVQLSVSRELQRAII